MVPLPARLTLTLETRAHAPPAPALQLVARSSTSVLPAVTVIVE